MFIHNVYSGTIDYEFRAASGLFSDGVEGIANPRFIVPFFDGVGTAVRPNSDFVYFNSCFVYLFVFIHL